MHQKYLDEQDKIKYYIFQVRVTQEFQTTYNIETDQGLEFAKNIVKKEMEENFIKVDHRQWNDWNPVGQLEVIEIEEE